jgi:hypothetical protein
VNSYEKAQEILDALVAFAAAQVPEHELPALQYAQVGGPAHVVCAVVTVAALSMSIAPGTPADCNAVQLAPFDVVIGRECAWEAEEDGRDIPAQVTDVSALIAADGELLWAFAGEYDPYLSKEWQVIWVKEGGIAVSVLKMTTGIN